MAFLGYLRQSTAVTAKIGPFLDETDGITDLTALTISQADVRLSKNGGNMAQKNESSACTHDEIGIYDCPLDTTDTGTIGLLSLFVHESGALPVRHDYIVLPESAWQNLMVASGNAVVASGTAQSGTASTIVLAAATSFADDVLNGALVVITGGTGAGQARAVTDWTSSSDTATVSPNWTTNPDGSSTYIVIAGPPGLTNAEIADAVWDEALSGHTTAGSAGKSLADTEADAASIATDLSQIDARIPAALTAGGHMPADVLAVSGDATAADTLELFAEALDQATGQLDSGSLAANTLTAAAIAADVTTELQSGLATAAALTTVDGKIDTIDGKIDTVDGSVDTLLAADAIYKKNVAVTAFGLYMELTDGSPGTGLTVAGEISKDGGAFASIAGAISEIGSGFYKVNLSQTEMNADEILLKFTATGAKQRAMKIRTQS